MIKLRQLLVGLLILSQLVSTYAFAREVMVGDTTINLPEPRKMPNQHEKFMGYAPANTPIGSHWVDSKNGTEWVIMGYRGEREFWATLFKAPDFSSQMAASEVLNLANTKGLGTRNALPNLRFEWPQNLPKSSDISNLQDNKLSFAADRFTQTLQGKMGATEFDKWQIQVNDYLKNPNSSGSPIPNYAPYATLSFPEVSEPYLQNLDSFISNSIEKMGTVQNHLMTYEVAQTAEVISARAWDCQECNTLPASLNFESESVRKGGMISSAANEYIPLSLSIAQSQEALTNYNFTMPAGSERSQLEGTYNLLKVSTPASPQGQTAKLIGLDAVVHADKSGAKLDRESFEFYKNIAIVMTDIALSLSPAAVAKDSFEAITGKSFLTGHDLTNFERGFAVFGAITLGIGSKIGLFSKAGAGIVTLAKTFGASEKLLNGMVHISSVAFGIGIKTKDAFRKAINIFKSERGFIQAGESLERAVTYGLKSPAGLKLFAKIESVLDAMPTKLRPILMHEGTDPSKVALIGRSMGDADKGLIGVRDANAFLKKTPDVEVAIFERSEAANFEFEQMLEKYRNEIGNPNARLPEEWVKKTLSYQENIAWIERQLANGATVLDVGNPNALKDISVFYEMEKTTIKAWKK